MKKKSTVILVIVMVIITILLFYKHNHKEYYITDNEYLYDVAIAYLKEEKYQSNDPDIEKQNYHLFLSYDGFAITKDNNYKYAYMWISADAYYLENEEKQPSSGYSMFFKFTFKDGKVIKYDIPKDGNEYSNSIKKMCLDSQMFKKILKYNSKLDNTKEIEEYYAKVTNASNLEKKDIIDDVYDMGLIFSITSKNIDCIPIKLSIYDNDKYILYTAYESCKKGTNCNSKLTYTVSEEGSYNFDIMKIIKNSKVADNMQFTNDEIPEYEIHTGSGELVYNLITDSDNKYLFDFLNEININLHTCAQADYES